jgi:hypothetical protein
MDLKRRNRLGTLSLDPWSVKQEPYSHSEDCWLLLLQKQADIPDKGQEGKIRLWRTSCYSLRIRLCSILLDLKGKKRAYGRCPNHERIGAFQGKGQSLTKELEKTSTGLKKKKRV